MSDVVRVMGLDISTRMGLSVVECRDGVHKLIQASEYEFKGMSGIERACALADVVPEMLAKHGSIDRIVIEDYAYATTNGLVYAVEIGTMVRYLLYTMDIEPLLVPPTSLKKFVTGVGNCNKDLVLMHVYKAWGFECPTNNIADAVGLGMYGLCSLRPSLFTKARQDVVTKPKAVAKKQKRGAEAP